MLLSEAFEAYRLEVLILKNMSPRTEESLLVTKKKALLHFGDIFLESLTHDEIRSWHLIMLKGKISPDTIRGYLLHFRVVLRHVRAKGYKILDSDLIAVPKRTVRVPNVLSAADITNLIDAFKPKRGISLESIYRNKTIVSMIYATGLRTSELCSLNRSDLHNKRATIIGKGGKPRIIFWDERTDILLGMYFSLRQDNSPALFVTLNKAKRMTRLDIANVFDWLKQNTNYKEVHSHTLRHSFATNLMQGGMHIYSLSRMMGHSNLETTKVYLHVSDPRLEEEYHRFHST
jgi:integrase/recombinase XerD